MMERMKVPEQKKDRYITVKTVTERLSCTDCHVYNMIREGKLQAIKLGQRAIRVSEQSLEEFIASRKIDPSEYFAPEEPPKSPDLEKPPAVARSRWMNR
jgi:excisionase family DNA binding protein